ncbi:MAG: hypothetical protein AAFO07_13750 [Bacteroidota bacterium]
MRYNNIANVLIVVYENTVIDLIKPNEIITLNQIRNFQNFVGEKAINDIAIESDSTILLAASYGVSRINLNSNEFNFTTFTTGIGVEAVTSFNNFIYATTEEGIYRITSQNRSPEDFSQWEYLDNNFGLPANYSSNDIQSFDNKLFADVNDSLYQILPSIKRIHYEEGSQIVYLSAEGQHLLMGTVCRSNTNCSGNRVLYFDRAENQGYLNNGCIGIPVNAIEDEQGRIWFGDEFRNYRVLNSVTDDFCRVRTYNSPYSEENREMTIVNNQLWLAAGGVNQTFSNRFLDHGFSSFIDGQWSIYNRWTTEILKGPLVNDPVDDMLDFLTIAVHPQNGKIYAGSFYEGLIEIDGENFTQYDENNSTLGNAIGDLLRTRISGLAFDDDNNLWVSNHSAENPLSVLLSDGSWKGFTPSCRQREIHQLAVDPNGYKWIISGNTVSGVLVFDEGEIDDPTDDRCRTFSSNNSELPTNNTNCLAVDLDGDVWVGTTEGIVIFDCGANAFEPPCMGTLRIVEQNGFGAFLLATENVQTIAVDGANRKWVGTQNGVFILSSDGRDQIAFFNTDNSPLFDNNVIDIAINQVSGEVFIGTNKGIISYKSDAIAGENVNNANIEVYPNPVRPEYTGNIAIRGLARDANVKITDIRGRLVYETQALGGQAIWDGLDYNGRRADTGVYLVFSTSQARFTGFTATPSAAVAKIVFIK